MTKYNTAQIIKNIKLIIYVLFMIVYKKNKFFLIRADKQEEKEKVKYESICYRTL